MAGWLQSGESSQVDREARADLLPLAATEEEPGFWSGTGSAFGSGLMRGAARAGEALMLAGSIVPRALDAVTAADNYSGRSLTEQYFDALDPRITDAVNYWLPDPHTTGTAGRVLSGIAEFAAPMMLSGGNPLAMATLTSAQAATGAGADIARAGGTAAEAGGVAAIQGAANLAGFGISTMGRTLLQRAAFGAGSNVAINMPADMASSAVLSGSPLADQYDPLNAEARSVDFVVGALFGAMASPDPALRPSREQVDAALTVNAATSAQRMAAPGILTTASSIRANADALADVQRKLMEGTALDGTEGTGVKFDPDPERERLQADTAAALDSELAGIELPVSAAADVAQALEPVAAASRLREVPVQAERDPVADAIMARADEVLSQNPDMPIAIEDVPGDKNSVRRLTAAEALEELKLSAAKAQEVANGYAAAVNCFIRGL